MRRKGKRVAVLMSGGVDSSVAAALLEGQGYDVIGITLLLMDYPSMGGNPHGKRGCCDLSNQADARAVCSQLGIPHRVLDLRHSFLTEVVKPYERTYLSGETPNPCVLCNSKIKWGGVLNKTDAMECDFIATGHYARILSGNAGVRLEMARDTTKDQSYALWQVRREALSKTLLPLGDWTKSEIRAEASRLELKTAEKQESQEACFIDDSYVQYLRDVYSEEVERIGEGGIVDASGRELGRHQGFFGFTVGQRKGLNIRDGLGPYYVNEIRPDSNTVVVGGIGELERNGCVIKDVNWISYDPPTGPEPCTVKIRYNDPGNPAVVFPVDEGAVEVRFEKLLKAVSPGQSAVWYRDNALWGGGIISHGLKE